MALTKQTITDKIEISGYEGRYSVTADGMVWSHPKGSNSKNGRWMNQDKSRKYATVCLIDSNGNRKRHLIHRLVASAFIGIPKNKKSQVNHKDGNKFNNCIDNLEWVTPSENILHAWKNGLCLSSEKHKESARNAGKSRRLFEDGEIHTIRALALMKNSQREIAEMFKTSQAVIQYIVSGKTYSEVV